MMNVFLRLGRVSNLPTVWTNALAAIVLINSSATVGKPILTFLLSGIALTLFYIGGMFLNDAFDAEIDKLKRANRPIPNGEIAKATVFRLGFALLAAGILVVAGFGWFSILTACALALAIIAYDAWHKKTTLAPVIMGSTRFLSYALAAVVAAGAFHGAAFWAAVGLFAYIIGLTYAAKNEEYDSLGSFWPLAVLGVPVLLCIWAVFQSVAALPFCLLFLGALGFAISRLLRRAPGDVPKAVVTMIAGISLFDATMIASSGHVFLASLAAVAFCLTLWLQKVASGT